MIENHIVAGLKSWNKHVFDEVISKYPGNWHFISNPKELTLDNISVINPRLHKILILGYWGERRNIIL